MPDWTEHVRTRLAPLRLDAAREGEIVEELSQHLDQRYEELRAAGTSAPEAHRLAIEELLEPGALADYMRSLRQANHPAPVAPGAPRRSLLGDLAQDLGFAARTLRRQPAFAAAAVLTLALGIGVNGAIFALVDATLLRPVPLPHPERLVMAWERSDTSQRDQVSPLNLRDWTERNRTFDLLAGFMPNVGGMVLAGRDGTAETVPRQWVTAGFFDVLGTRPIVGRTFRDSDDRQRLHVVVLTEGFWRSRFGADPGVVGRDIRLDGRLHTVVGVVPDEAQLLARTSIWAMVPVHGAPPAARGIYLLEAIGRMKPGVTLETARADIVSVAEGLAREFPKTNAGRGATLEPRGEAAGGTELRRTSMLVRAVVAFVLLICCANVANLLLARATARTRELAIRSTLGADRSRVVRQLLTESVLLSFVGGALGIAVGAAVLSISPLVIPPGLLPPAVTLGFDLRVVAFCAAAALGVGLLFGLAPAWHATRIAPAQALTGDSRTTTGGGGRIRALLVAGEVATAVVLLFAASLLLRTLLAVERVDRGYSADGVLTMIVDPLGSRYPTPESLLQFFDEIEREVAAVPGVRGVAWASTLPLGPSYAGQSFFEVLGEPLPAESQRPTADYQIVSPSYFRTLDLPVVEGRAFDDRDRRGTTLVCLVNEAFVRRHLRGASPLRKRLALRSTASPDDPAVVREVVGVVRQVKGRPDEIEDLVQVYVPLAQDPMDDLFMVVRPAAGSGDALAPAVRAAIGRIDKEQLVSVRGVMTLEDIAWEATARHRFRAILVAAFAALAIVLAMVGLFGTLAYTVQQRVRDFGVRRALGATNGEMLRTVVLSAARVVAAGVLIGLALATASSRLLATMLYGVRPLDPLTFALVPGVLALTAAVAIAGPAWRATRVDPAVALRSE